MSIPEKLKKFFRITKDSSVSSSSSAADLPRIAETFTITSDLKKEIGEDSQLQTRVRIVRDLCEVVNSKQLEDNAVETLWTLVKDLYTKQPDEEARGACILFFCCLIRGQYSKLGTMRAHFFNVIVGLGKENINGRMDMLSALTFNGRDIDYFEDEIGPFLAGWMSTALSSHRSDEFLKILLNVIKHNAAYLNEDDVLTIIESTCYFALRTNSRESVLKAVDVMDAILCYSVVPLPGLVHFITTMCRMVNLELLCKRAWTFTRNLLGTGFGNSSIKIMLEIIQDRKSDPVVMRGAVFFLSMGLWGTNRVQNLIHRPRLVLPAFLKALSCSNTVVIVEVAQGVQRLVQRFGGDLPAYEWDHILNILDGLLLHMQVASAAQAIMLAGVFHNTLTYMEQLHDDQRYSGSEERFFNIIDRCAAKRPESSVMKMISFYSHNIEPRKLNWIGILEKLVDKYFRNEKRSMIRCKVLQVVRTTVLNYRYAYEDELVDRVIVPYFLHISLEEDVDIRTEAVKVLVDLAIACDKKCSEILDSLEKVRPVDDTCKPEDQDNNSDTVNILNEKEVHYIQTAVGGIIQLFKAKLFISPYQAVRTFHLLIKHVSMYYERELQYTTGIRCTIYECFLQIRVNEHFQVGLPDKEGDSSVHYTPFVTCDPAEKSKYSLGSSSPPVASPGGSNLPGSHLQPVYLPLDLAFEAIIRALQQEKDWPVLEVILKELQKATPNKSLLMAVPSMVDELCYSLGSLVSNNKLPGALRNIPRNFSGSEFHLYFFPVLTALVPLHKYMEGKTQRLLVKCLQLALVTRTVAPCVVALSVSALEMHDTMFKLISGILLYMSKLTCTTKLAVPVLEFLSNLIHMPSLYASFTRDQYISIFAVALPYTNPFKFNHYVVSLAHHVIAMWFIKCRMPLRRDYIPYILKGLHTNALEPFNAKSTVQRSNSDVSGDSSFRRRASSMHEQGLARRRETVRPATPSAVLDPNAPVIGAIGAGDLKFMMNLHKELSETCIDLLSRYAFSNYPPAAATKRAPYMDFLLGKGQQQTWLVGVKLITITTSGYASKSLTSGLCDECQAICKAERGEEETEEQPQPDVTSGSRRRHRSAVVRSVTVKVKPQVPRTKDDSALHELSELPEDDIGTNKGYIPGSMTRLLRVPTRLCCCWCQGYAEVRIRQPSGNTSFVLRFQNLHHGYPKHASAEPKLDDLRLLLPSSENIELSGSPIDRYDVGHARHRRIDSENMGDAEYEVLRDHIFSSGEMIFPMGDVPPTPPADRLDVPEDFRTRIGSSGADIPRPSRREKAGIRRVNSSPEMKYPLTDAVQKDKEARELQDAAQSSTCGDQAEGTVEEKSSTVGVREVVAGGGGQLGAASDFTALTSTQAPSDDKPQQQTEVASKPEDSIPAVKPAEPVSTLGLAEKGTLERKPSLEKAETSSGVRPKVRIPSREDAADGAGPSSPSSPSLLNAKTKSPPRSPLFNKNGSFDLASSRLRDRSQTVSEPMRSTNIKPLAPPKDQDYKSGLSPSHVFLQLYYTGIFGTATDERPLLVQKVEHLERAVKLLDIIPPYETHKIGVVYVGPGQANDESAFLSNTCGSTRYCAFLRGIGPLLKLADVDPICQFLGGLDQGGEDGEYAYVWSDDLMQVIFHVTTLMPNRDSDPHSNAKKRHVGNDYVVVVYNNSGEEFNIQTIKGQCTYACIVVEPLDHDYNLVSVKARPELTEMIGESYPRVISDKKLSILARQLAIHTNLASTILKSQQQSISRDLYVSNWLERLRNIKRLRAKLEELLVASEEGKPTPPNPEGPGQPPSSRSPSPKTRRHFFHVDDFTKYT